MPIPQTDTSAAPPDKELRADALKELRLGANPFSMVVAAVGTTAEALQSDVRRHTDNQLNDLCKIIQSYRQGKTDTRIHPVLGEPGTGKTHLLYVLRAELRDRARTAGEETMLVVVEHLATGMDPIDYLLWMITNSFLASKGDAERMLQVIAGRLTGKLLAESLRRLTLNQQAELIPTKGLWQGLKRTFGSASLAQQRTEALGKLIEVCDGDSPTPFDLRQGCQDSEIPRQTALRVLTEHLDRTEPKNAVGWFRKELYGRLAQFVLLENREPFEDFHNGAYDAPVYVKEGGNLSRCLLDAWLELLGKLHVPVVVVFDQLEDYLRAPTKE